MRKGNSSNFQYGPDRWFSVPGAFKLEHLQPFKPILFPKFFKLFTFILESPFLLPKTRLVYNLHTYLLFELLVVERRTTEIEPKSLEQWPTTKDERARAPCPTEP